MPCGHQLLQQNQWCKQHLPTEVIRSTVPNAQGCRFFPSYYSKSRALRGQCKTCRKSLQWSTATSRLIAIYKLPSDQFWKGVVTREDYPHKYFFEGSGRCNMSSHGNHCMNESHLNLETYRHNARRRGHHRGTRYVHLSSNMHRIQCGAPPGWLPPRCWIGMGPRRATLLVAHVICARSRATAQFSVQQDGVRRGLLAQKPSIVTQAFFILVTAAIPMTERNVPIDRFRYMLSDRRTLDEENRP
jgi:hypothetical protein